jgi:preprotein translocase subunit SecG
MHTVLIVIHLLIVIALVGVVLLQRSEGGALGIGGGGGFMSARGTANALTRATAMLAVGFFVTSLALAVLAGQNRAAPSSVLDRAAPAAVPAQPSGPQVPTATPPVGQGQGGILDDLQRLNRTPGSTPPTPAPAQ